MNYDWEKEFYAPWDQFVKAWWDEKADPSDLVTKGYKKGRKLDLNELPEPYLGSPKNAKAVVINYNPGTSTANEDTKFFSSYNRKGALITEFVDNHRNLYSSYNKKWSSLNSSLDNFRPAIPGVKWWKGRFRWIERFMMHFPCIAAGGIKRENVFALEMCPYHSKAWQGGLEDNNVADFVKKYVIIPAACAVIENNLPCAVCVGEKIGEVFKSKFKMRTINKWDSGYDYCGNIIPDWPKGKSGFAKRRYELFELNGSADGCFKEAIGANKVLFLVLSSAGSNKLPSLTFDKVEVLQVLASIRHSFCNPVKKGRA